LTRRSAVRRASSNAASVGISHGMQVKNLRYELDAALRLGWASGFLVELGGQPFVESGTFLCHN
jgi:hypothetical protein